MNLQWVVFFLFVFNYFWLILYELSWLVWATLYSWDHLLESFTEILVDDPKILCRASSNCCFWKNCLDNINLTSLTWSWSVTALANGSVHRGDVHQKEMKAACTHICITVSCTCNILFTIACFNIIIVIWTQIKSAWTIVCWIKKGGKYPLIEIRLYYSLKLSNSKLIITYCLTFIFYVCFVSYAKPLTVFHRTSIW